MGDGVPGTGLGLIYESPKIDVNWESFEEFGCNKGQISLVDRAIRC